MSRTMLLLAVFAITAHAAEPEANGVQALEDRLARVELRVSKYESGNQEFIAGLARLEPRLRQVACHAYPSQVSLETIALINADIRLLEKPENFEKLSDAQKVRVQEQKQHAAKLSPTIDCSKI